MTSEVTHIYGPRFSNFVRSVMLVCEEKNIPYTVGFEINGENVPFKSEEHLAMHPFGKIPVLVQNQLVLPETSSICRYLDKDRQLQPSNSLDFARHDALCASISIDIDKVLVREYLFEFAFPKGEGNTVRIDVVKELRDKVDTTMRVIEKILTQNTAIATEQFTIADALIAPMLHYLSCLPADYNPLSDYPIIEQYLASLMKRSSCQKVLIDKVL